MNLSIKSSFLGISIKCRSKSYVYLGSMHAATERNKYKFEVLVLKLSISIFCPFYNGSKWCTWYKIVQSLINLFKNHLPNIILNVLLYFCFALTRVSNIKPTTDRHAKDGSYSVTITWWASAHGINYKCSAPDHPFLHKTNCSPLDIYPLKLSHCSSTMSFLQLSLPRVFSHDTFSLIFTLHIFGVGVWGSL